MSINKQNYGFKFLIFFVNIILNFIENVKKTFLSIFTQKQKLYQV